MPVESNQLTLFEDARPPKGPSGVESTFVDNMRLPVHRWFRYSAGFSAAWVESLIQERRRGRKRLRVFDPFAGSATTLLAAQDAGVESVGVESHPFVARIARAKLARSSDPRIFRRFARAVLEDSAQCTANVDHYPALIPKCYRPESLTQLDQLRRSLEVRWDDSPAAELTRLALIGILRSTSHVGTANWQYVLPRKEKKKTLPPFEAFERQFETMTRDMALRPPGPRPQAELFETDARRCDGIDDGSVDLVVTSPPYPNNYDYADATRLEMSFFGEIRGWGDLQQAVRRRLVRSCSQHVPEKTVDLDEALSATELSPIADELSAVCRELGRIRLSKGGKKTYHLMVACYFRDLADVWTSLRRVARSPCEVCFVVGDSAPYGVHVPVMDWLGRLALAAGFGKVRFEKTRDRNVKWKNRKHRVPLCEGRLWVEG